MKLLDFFNYQKNMSLCGICNEYIKAENSTPSSCSHAFHVTCLKNWIESHRSDNQCKCPSKQCCRTFTAISIRNSIGGPVTKNISLAYDNQCPICCEEIEPPVATPESCNHHFCFSCLKEWAKIRHECPLDRGAFELILLSQYIGGPITDRRQAPPAFRPPPEEEDTTECEICHTQQDEANLLLCDSCDKGYHTYCLPSPLSEIPEGDWFCPSCEDAIQQRSGTQSEEETTAEHTTITATPRRSRRRTRFADMSAEETDGDGEESLRDVDGEGDFSYIGYLTPESQARLGRIAEQRHRGTGLLRDLIDQLMDRAQMEQQRRRDARLRQRQSRRRRRVRLSESVLSPTQTQQPSSQRPSTSSPLLPTVSPPELDESRPVGTRKRCRIVDSPASSSSETESLAHYPLASIQKRPSHQQKTDGENDIGGPDSDSFFASPPRRATARRRLRLISNASASPRQVRLQQETEESEDDKATVSSSKEDEEEGDGDEYSSGSLSETHRPANEEEDEGMRPGTSRCQTAPAAALNDSRQDLFASFTSDPVLSGIFDNIHSIARQGTALKSAKKRKVIKRRKTMSKKRKSKSRKSAASTSRRKPLKKKKKRVRLNSTQRSIQDSIQSLASPSPNQNPLISTPVKKRGSVLRTSNASLSLFGAELNCGLLSEPENNAPPLNRQSPPRSSLKHKSTGSGSLLSQLEAAQSSLFEFRTSNMQVNPDNSVSPLPSNSASSSSSRPSRQNGRPSTKSGPPLNTPSRSSQQNGDSSASVAGTSKANVAMVKATPQTSLPSTSTSISESTPLNGHRSTEAWSSDDATRVRKLLENHLVNAHPGVRDTDTKKRIIQRTLMKVLAKKPNRVTTPKMIKLVDDYVSFYQRNPH